MNGIDFTKIIASIFSPAVEYFKQHGVWDPMVKIYQLIYGVTTSLWSWLNANVDMQKVTDVAITFIKFVLNIFLTLFGALSNIATWILHLFK